MPSACGKAGKPPGPSIDPAAYEALVGQFDMGVAALEVSDPSDRALKSFTKVTELAPDEPAGWANLAITQLGPKGSVEAARIAVDRALRISPVASDVAFVAALVAEREGRTAEALTALEQAVATDGANLRARYRLFQTLEHADVAAARGQLEAIVAAAPANRLGRLELARLLAKASDIGGSTTQLAALWVRAEVWSLRLSDQRTLVESAAKAGDAAALSTAVTILGNLLVEDPAFVRDAGELRSPVNPAEQPIRRLLALPEPAPDPAAPDPSLRFRAEPLNAPGARWASAAHLAGEGPPMVILGMDDGVRLLAAEPVDLAYPAGEPPLSPEGFLAADLDNDRRPDLLLVGARGLRLYRQMEDGAFQAVNDKTGLDATVLDAAYRGAWSLDLDLDGDLDVALGVAQGKPPVLRNNGDGSWAVAEPFDMDGLNRLIWTDFDGDGDGDVVARDAAGRLVRLDNQRNGRYQAAVEPSPLDAQDFAAIDLAAEADGRRQDGVLDLALLRLSAAGAAVDSSFPFGGTEGAWQTGPQLLSPDALSKVDPALGKLLTSGMDAPSTAAPVGRLLTGDIDNNGAVDLVLGGLPEGGLVLDLAGLVLSRPAATIQAVIDLDQDGRLDLVGTDRSGRPLRLINEGGAKAYHFQRIRPRGLEIPAAPSGGAQASAASGDQRINSFGLGGQISVRVGRLNQTRPIDGPAVHLGLGTKTTADLVYIQWPNGVAQAEFDLPADGEAVALQRLKGSCPWLFADDGDGLRFVTDILWRSPLGLRINAVDTAGVVQTRDWVNLRPDQLRPVNGRYELAVTAELWETHFFDEMKLLVVDHPADVVPAVDERFAIPPPPLALQPLTDSEPIDAATDQRGQDVTATIRDLDERYLDGFGIGTYQGIAPDHWVELDLGGAADRLQAKGLGADGLVLLAQGWIYPTDSSINVAIGQGRTVAPKPLAMQVQEADGRWRTVGPALGFPAGKHKTLLIDLAGMDPAGGVAPRRVRLATNLEVYWDRLSLAARAPETQRQQTELAPTTADLSYRGFSVTSHFGTVERAPRSQPEVPDYSRLASLRPIWIDLGGNYTRFGDVRDLLAGTDDRYVILNAGDQIRLSFPVPPSPPAGWTRSFVFISDGWEKDGDFNTAYGGTVLPLPSHDRPEYADPVIRGPATTLEADPVFQR
ncbi:MAG TPA: FG-GAP-like repeat-containing protein, partial [Anaerolineae bacterium]|nr:FG-GAP-like repeat-containing protein [Anaerolineae bacterium]